MKKWFLALLLFSVIFLPAKVIERYYLSRNASAVLRSETPQELITASTNHAACLIDPLKREIHISIPMATFTNFGEKAYHDHFNKKLMETGKYPVAVFKGKLPAGFSELKKGMQSLYVFGNLEVHGISRERTL